MRVYATTSDLPGAVSSALGASVSSYLGEASALVEEATVADRYTVDDEGYPSEDRVFDAFRDATVAQVAYWHAARVNPIGGVLAQTPDVTSQSAEGSAVSYGSMRNAAELASALGLCDSARRILRLAQLTDGNAVPRLR